MAVCLINKSGGGVTSDDITARREHVLQGYTALTADSDDEITEGTIPNRGHRGSNTDNFSEVNSFGGYVVGFAEGYYKNEDGRQPYVVVPTATVKNAVGYKPEKTLNDTVTCGERGTIPVRGYHGPDSSEMWLYSQEGGYAARIEEGYYHKGGGHKPYVIVPLAKVKQAVGYRPDKTLSDTTTCEEQGQIPIWESVGSDVAIANISHSGQGFVYDHPTLGRVMVVGVKNGAYIKNINYVALPVPNLYPNNVVKDANINGITGARNWIDNIGEQMIAQNVEISMMNRNQSISIGNAYANSETVFFGVETVGEDVWDGFVRRDKGNGRYLIGRIPVSKNDGNLLGTFIRNAPVQIEIVRDNAGNISLIHHGPNQVLGATKLNVYIYAHSSISFRL